MNDMKKVEPAEDVVVVSLRLPPRVMVWLRLAAKARGITMHQLIEEVLASRAGGSDDPDDDGWVGVN